jgi:hypothetical protein
MAKKKVLGIKYGIEITKPWSQEMYLHNDLVAAEMKKNIVEAIIHAYNNNNLTVLREIGKSICAYSFYYDITAFEMYNKILSDLQHVQNYWLNDEYSWLVSKGYVKEVEINFVGYDK